MNGARVPVCVPVAGVDALPVLLEIWPYIYKSFHEPHIAFPKTIM